MFVGLGFGVLVGAAACGVSVGGSAVAVGSASVGASVGGAGVSVGGRGVSVGGTGVLVGSGVLVGVEEGVGVVVLVNSGRVVLVGVGVIRDELPPPSVQPASTSASSRTRIPDRNRVRLLVVKRFSPKELWASWSQAICSTAAPLILDCFRRWSTVLASCSG